MKFSHYMGFRQPDVDQMAIVFASAPLARSALVAVVNSTIARLWIGDAKTISVMNRPPAQVHGCDLALGYISQGITPYARRLKKGASLRIT
jgi:hypothetical protein